jgi:hypothetical protein
VKMEEKYWSKNWINFTEWEMEEGSWKAKIEFLEKIGIQHILGAPQVADMGRWKEEEEKFSVSWYHQGYL